MFEMFSNFSSPGPGVDKGAPRKTGIPRFFELLGRDLPSFYKASILTCIGFIPVGLGVSFGISGGFLGVTILAAVLGGLLAGPVLAGMADTVLRALRDEPGYWWHTYKSSFARNWKGAMLPGAVCSLVVSMQIFVVYLMLYSVDTGIASWVLMLLSIAFFTAFMTYFWAQYVLMELPVMTLIQNSLLMCIAFLPRTLLAVLVQVAYWAVMLLYLPFSLTLMLVFGFWLPLVLGYMLVYPSMDKLLHLEDRIHAKRDAEVAGEVDWGAQDETDEEK